MKEVKKYKRCRKCKQSFEYTDKETSWDYKGFTPTKIVACKNCGCIQAVRYDLRESLFYANG